MHFRLSARSRHSSAGAWMGEMRRSWPHTPWLLSFLSGATTIEPLARVSATGAATSSAAGLPPPWQRPQARPQALAQPQARPHARPRVLARPEGVVSLAAGR